MGQGSNSESTDPCNDTKYIIMSSLSKEKKATQEELDSAVGHLQACKGCREQFELHERAQFAADAARKPKPHKTTRRVVAQPPPPPKDRETDIFEAS